ncbi:hypothetical protein HC024_21040 [Methylococcaceae bacterium WWC4]|nr:hypothetical protein [Methylococcaceae bacterium WWC4]
MSSDALFESLTAVKDEATFLRFVGLLAEDRAAVESASLSPDGFQGKWSNQTIPDFLLAAKAWAEDSNFGTRPGPKPSNPWALMATFLWAGRIYE